MADQFDSTDIFIAVGNVPHTNALIFSERPIPGSLGSPVTYVDISTRQLGRISLVLFFKGASTALSLAAYTAMKNKVGTTAALNTTTFGNFSAALLINVGQADVAPLGERHAVCEFLIT